MTKARLKRLTKAALLKDQIERLCQIHGISIKIIGNLWKFENRGVKLSWSPLNNTFSVSGDGHSRHLRRLQWLRCHQADWILDGLRELAGSRQSLNPAASPLGTTPPVACQQSTAPA